MVADCTRRTLEGKPPTNVIPGHVLSLEACHEIRIDVLIVDVAAQLASSVDAGDRIHVHKASWLVCEEYFVLALHP